MGLGRVSTRLCRLGEAVADVLTWRDWARMAGRLSFMACSTEPAAIPGVHYFSMDKVMTYRPFCADFGPFNLGMTHHFCEVLKDQLRMPRMANVKIVYFTSTQPNDITNAMFLLGTDCSQSPLYSDLIG